MPPGSANGFWRRGCSRVRRSEAATKASATFQGDGLFCGGTLVASDSTGASGRTAFVHPNQLRAKYVLIFAHGIGRATCRKTPSRLAGWQACGSATTCGAPVSSRDASRLLLRADGGAGPQGLDGHCHGCGHAAVGTGRPGTCPGARAHRGPPCASLLVPGRTRGSGARFQPGHRGRTGGRP